MSKALESREVERSQSGRLKDRANPGPVTRTQCPRPFVWPIRGLILAGLLLAGWFLLGGCSALPRRYVEQTVYNPFPELSRVAIVPFFNHSKEPTVNGVEFARAYYLELQSVPGFEVVPVDIVHQTLIQHRIALNGPEDVRRLAQLLDVDAVVIGAVTDYRPYYPPRLGLHVEWYARDPHMQPILPGFGIPWGTRRARKLPDWIALEASLAWAREMLRRSKETDLPGKSAGLGNSAELPDPSARKIDTSASQGSFPDLQEASFLQTSETGNSGGPANYPPEFVPVPLLPPSNLSGPSEIGESRPDVVAQEGLPPAGSNQDLPSVSVSTTVEPVMVHTRVYNGNDPQFAKALATYYHFREEARFGGWQGYLERSDDFIRFCCRLHIHEMLMARGGAGKKRVLWDWPLFR